ncbi:MAG TPA: UDP-N-acetylmuramoyl-L-alanyl-D-glutamate--2,6-diaminopimelate ligase [Anaerolineales bacterium]
MRLAELLQGLPEIDPRHAGGNEILGLTDDSREVRPGFVFVAVRGLTVDGHAYLEDAARGGAAALVGEVPDPGLTAPYFRVPDSRLALARLAAAWHGFPARRLVLIGVTGTEGKTTTATLIRAILRRAGHPTGLISTVHAVVADQVRDTGLHVTTPDAADLQGLLADMVRAGETHAVVEATSHGLAQHRLAACAFDVGVVTHIEREHLDFHGTLEAYREAKGMLFRYLSEGAPKTFAPRRTAILNRDDSSFEFLERITAVRTVSYGRSASADVRLSEVNTSLDGASMRLTGKAYAIPVRTRLIGLHNARNCAAAFAAAVEALGVPPETAAAGIAGVESIPGRMEVIDVGQPFGAVVDFAHSPNAVRRALEVGRQLTRGRLIALFGAVALRDRENRRLMAEAGAELADRIVFTADDPRTESLAEILRVMAEAAASRGAKEGETFWRVPDRATALRFAVGLARPGDLVMALGKGHEQSMAIGEYEYPWDDRTALRAALAESLGVPGPAMPFLPDEL